MRLVTALGLTLALTAAATAQDGVMPQPDEDTSPTTESSEPAPAPEAAPAPSAEVLVPIERDETPVPSLNLMVEQVEDMEVIGADNNKIGDVDDVLGDQNGEPQAIVIEVGGFLGVGEKRVILMLDDVTLETGTLRTPMTKEQFESLPEYAG